MNDEKKADRERDKLDEVTSYRLDDDRMKGKAIQTAARNAQGAENLINSGSTMAGDAANADDLSDTPDPKDD